MRLESRFLLLMLRSHDQRSWSKCWSLKMSAQYLKRLSGGAFGLSIRPASGRFRVRIPAATDPSR